MNAPRAAVPPLDGRTLRSVLRMADARMAEPLSVADLADHAGYSPHHFSRMFAAAARVPPAQYLTAARMQRAKHLLLTTSDPVVDIATCVGFESLSSFTRRFHAVVGVPPAGLRELADRISDRPVRPFRLTPSGTGKVRVRPLLPPDADTDHTLWIGWYAQPAPVGLPAGGVLVEHCEVVELALCPGAPWLLGFAVADDADVHGQLAPRRPLVASYGDPLDRPAAVTLDFAREDVIPMLSALPSLAHRR